MVVHFSILGSCWLICPVVGWPHLQMADPAGLSDSPLCSFARSASPPRGRKRPCEDGAWSDVQQGKRDRHDRAFQLAFDSALAGPSQPRDVNSTGLSLEDRVSHLGSIVADLIAKLDCGDFSGFGSIKSAGSEDGEVREAAADPLAGLDDLGGPRGTLEDADFHRALEELARHFHGQEKKGEPLSDCLAGILDDSLRCRPTSEG
ncbi:hypothetical protein E2C01_071906 [Portunus trituberculatus]|uniref:Uncharacterized protein n=1 Tax=Portunus trituberculatus TaxID=210409 RepID=A0A5B7HWJ4_PORTR|nr:hypothetical protein [Portunus trituberculatus]